jgi:hypothetical protein
VEVLGPEAVVLLLGDAVGGLLDRELDAERLELGAVGVEPAGEGVLVHAAVALDVAPDLQRGHRATLRHEVRDERELTDELLGVLRHMADDDTAPAPAMGRSLQNSTRSFRRFGARYVRSRERCLCVHAPCTVRPS